MLKPTDSEWRQMPWSQALDGASPKVAHALAKALAGVDLGLEEEKVKSGRTENAQWPSGCRVQLNNSFIPKQ